MKSIRRSVFETNSSSTHSITIVSEEDFEKWKTGELILDTYSEMLVPITEDTDDHDYQFKTKEDWDNNRDLEGYEERYTTKSGDKIVVFGEFGYDG